MFTAENHNRPTLFQCVIGMNDSTFTDMEILTRTLTWCETECTPLEDERDGTTNKDEREQIPRGLFLRNAYEPVREKINNLVPTRSDTNRTHGTVTEEG